MPKEHRTQNGGAIEIQQLLRRIDRELHRVIKYTHRRSFDLLTAARLMDHLDVVYRNLGYHRFTGLLLELNPPMLGEAHASLPSNEHRVTPPVDSGHVAA